MLIDLSVTLNDHTPVYPGDPATKIVPAGNIAKDGYCDHYISIGSHVGTHIDAPMHMLADGKSLDQVPIDQFTGQGRLIEVNDIDFSAVKSAGIQSGDIVLFYTGMSEKYMDPEYFEKHPVMSDEVAKFLVQVGVKMVGIDACSVDNQDGFPIHKLLLAGGVLIIENLVNMEQLVGKSFKIYALPIKLQVDGAPARVIAETL